MDRTEKRWVEVNSTVKFRIINAKKELEWKTTNKYQNYRSRHMLWKGRVHTHTYTHKGAWWKPHNDIEFRVGREG